MCCMQPHVTQRKQTVAIVMRHAGTSDGLVQAMLGSTGYSNVYGSA